MEKTNNVWKMISIFGIPLTALLTWAFVAGGVVQDVRTHTKEIETLKTEYVNLDSRLRTSELGIVRIEVQFKQIFDALKEIKDEIKNNRVK